MNDKFVRAEMLLGAEALEKLKNSHVAVFGLGGVGSWCAEALARSGVGSLTVVDQDTVGESNINRQLCALDSTIGAAKADVVASRIKDISPGCKVNSLVRRYEASARDGFFAESLDYIVDAIDLVSCKVDLICSAMEREIPIISALGTGNKTDAQRLKIGDISKTQGCPLARVVRRELRKKGIYKHAVVFSDELAMEAAQIEEPPPGRRSVPGSLVWVPATAGLLLCQHVVTELIKE